MRNPKWNKYEISLLIDGYNRVIDGKTTKKEVATNISERLRSRGLSGSTTYRNINGIILQLGAIEFLMTNGAHGISHVSSLFREIVKLYKKDYCAYQKLLDEANQLYPKTL